jgi:hypothetical protein
MLLAKILIVALSLFLQGKYFSEKNTPVVENVLDTLALPADRPELVLAKRAMNDHGLCPSSPTTENNSDPRPDSASISPAPLGLASNCF